MTQSKSRFMTSLTLVALVGATVPVEAAPAIKRAAAA